MKKSRKIAGVILLLLFAYIYAHVAKTSLIYDKQVDTSDYISLGIQPVAVEQEFVCQVKSLDAVSVKCQLNGEEENIKIRMTLKETESGMTLAVSERNGTDLKNGKFNNFWFEKIEGCEGKHYTVIMENAGTNLEIGIGAGFVCQPATEDETKLLVAGEQREGTLIMKTVTKGFDIETFCIVIIMILYIVFLFRFLDRLFSR